MSSQTIEEARRRQPSARDGGPRVPPHNLEAEASLLGAMLLRREAIGEVAELQLTPDSFYRPAHGHIFAAVMDIYSQGEPADPVTVAEELRRAGVLEGMGGPAALVALQANTPAIGNAARYATIVAEHHLLRRLIEVCGTVAGRAYEVPDDVAGALDDAEAALYALRRGPDARAAVPMADAMHRALDRVEERSATGGLVEGTTGLRDLDERTDGLLPGRLWTIASRPGHGKSSLACSICAHVGTRAPVLVVSVEMSDEEWALRLAAAEARLVGNEIMRGQISEHDWGRLTPAASHIATLPIEIYDGSSATLLSVRAQARRVMERRGSLGVIVVDYLQLMQGRRSAENRQVEVSELSRGMKVLARELKVPVVQLVQVGQGVETRSNKRPTSADLRESGSPWNDSDVVCFLYVDEKYNRDTDQRGVCEIDVAKHRNGPTGVVRVAWDMPSGRWSDLTQREAV